MGVSVERTHDGMVNNCEREDDRDRRVFGLCYGGKNVVQPNKLGVFSQRTHTHRLWDILGEQSFFCVPSQEHRPIPSAICHASDISRDRRRGFNIVQSTDCERLGTVADVPRSNSIKLSASTQQPTHC